MAPVQYQSVTRLEQSMARILPFITAFITFLATPSITTAQETIVLDRAPLASVIGHRDVSFLAHDLETDTRYVLEGSQTEERHAPWSTFKIPNLLIALETGIVSDLDTVKTWDQSRRPPLRYWPNSWRQDQSLRTAFQRSTVWYFQDIALEVGSELYQTILTDWEYGNASVPEGSDRFWLNSGLEVSVDEQVAFLERLVRNELGTSEITLDALIATSLAEHIGSHALHGKTGSGPVMLSDFSGRFEGWYVGFVLRAQHAPIVFALHTEGPNFRSIRTFRQEFATRLLIEAELLPPAFGD